MANLPKLLDAYNMRARVLPAVIAATPVIVTAALMVSWNSFGLPQVFVGLASTAALVAMADIARRQGTRVQRNLFKKWGGSPSSIMLRDADTTFDQETKETWRAFLATRVKGPPPRADAATLDAFYDRACHWLRENTRHKKKFTVLFEENVTYGYQRNLLGLRWPAIIIDSVIILGVVAAIVVTPGDHMLALAVSAAFALLHMSFMLLAVSESAVREAADRYGRQLLLSCAHLGGPPTKRAPSKRKVA